MVLEMTNTDVFGKISRWAIVIFAIVLLVSCLLTAEYPFGEWDDYLFTTASMLNDQNMSISTTDIEYAYNLFPEITNWGQFKGSSFTTNSGDTLPWYFGTYSAACIPMIWLLEFLRLPPIYAFRLTNIFAYIFVLLYISRNVKLPSKSKLLLVLLLIFNPAIFYIVWNSAEVFIFSLVILIMVFWTNEEYCKTALFISIASSLNPTLLALAPIVTIDYAYHLITGDAGKQSAKSTSFIKKNYKGILLYCISYLLAIIPLAYNYINTGHINLTSGTSGFFDNPLVFPRFWAYLTDFNFGILPYFAPAFLLSLVLCIVAILKRTYRSLLMMLGFMLTVFAYSFMSHINSGMSGISRYNSWSAPIMLFFVAVNYDRIFEKRVWKRIAEVIICISLLWSGLIVYRYGLMGANRTSYVEMSPAARFVLGHYPSFYNPLPSTFNSRIQHVDGGYDYNLPLYYIDEYGHIRKILVSRITANSVLDNVDGDSESMDYLKDQLSKLGNAESYISINLKYNLFLLNPVN